MLMKEFERTENELENKVIDTQKRFDDEQTKVNKVFSFSFSFFFSFFFFYFSYLNFKEKLTQKRKISIL
jgi:hypothetical protein